MRDWAKKAIMSSGALRCAGTAWGAGAAILMYHSVLPDPEAQTDVLGGIAHSAAEFRAQMELLARDYRPVSLNDVVKNLCNGRELPIRSVVVTFDDGYADNYEVAMPILSQLGVPAVFYVTVDCVENRTMPWPSRLRYAFRKTNQPAWVDGRSNSWILKDSASREQAFLAASDECCRLSGEGQQEFVRRIETELQIALPHQLGSLMMSHDQVRALTEHGHTVGSHTMSHPNMAYIKEDEAHRELADSKRRLESHLGFPVKHFSYPCPALSPHWTDRTVELSREAGYESGVTANSGLAHRGDDPLTLKRMRPTKTTEGLRWNLECAFAGRV